MANELTVSAVSGLTLTIQLYSGAVPFGSPITMTEIGSTGVYVGSVPGGTPYGQYMAIAFSNSDTVIASGQLWWDGQYEIPISMIRIAGFDPNNPAVNKASQRQSGDINLKVDGYGTDTTTVTRQ